MVRLDVAMNEASPKTIYDMYGFPKELYEVKYDTAGSPGMAKISKELISRETKYVNSWGIDHGTWSCLPNFRYHFTRVQMMQFLRRWV